MKGVAMNIFNIFMAILKLIFHLSHKFGNILDNFSVTILITEGKVSYLIIFKG